MRCARATCTSSPAAPAAGSVFLAVGTLLSDAALAWSIRDRRNDAGEMRAPAAALVVIARRAVAALPARRCSRRTRSAHAVRGAAQRAADAVRI